MMQYHTPFLPFSLFTAVMLLITVFPQTAHSCCCPTYHLSVEVLHESGDDVTVELQATSAFHPEPKTLSTTATYSDFLTHLCDAYNAAGACFIGTVTNVLEEWTPFSPQGKSYTVHHVTVSIPTVYKGSIENRAFAFTDTLFTPMRQIVERTDGTGYDTLKMMVSISDPGYLSWEGKTYLKFSESENPADSLLRPLRQGACSMILSGYVLDSNGAITTADVTVDFNNDILLGFLGLSVTPEAFIDAATPVAPRPLATRPLYTTTAVMQMYDLRGARISSLGGAQAVALRIVQSGHNRSSAFVNSSR